MRGMISRRRRDPEDDDFAMGRDFLRTFGLAVSTEFLTLWILIRGGTELLEVLRTEGQDIH